MLVIPHLILTREGKILLTRRASTKTLWPNHWHCVTGTVETGESPKQAIIREAYEEIGITLDSVTLAITAYLDERSFFEWDKRFYGLELFFWAHCPDDQDPYNAEPHKQDAIGWFDPRNLPSPMIPGVTLGIEAFLELGDRLLNGQDIYREFRLHY